MAARKRKRTTKADWFEAALRVLRTEGHSSVRVERLARDLDISKSGFYWHFRDRRDLELQLLDYWAHEYTCLLYTSDAADESSSVYISVVAVSLKKNFLKE